jgi:hypothetical protein
MMKPAAFGLAAMLLATPVLATEWVNCAAPDGAATFDFLTGTVDVLAVVGLNMTVGEQVWANSAAYGPGEPVSIGQAFEDADTIRIDVVDENVTAIVARLRLFKAAMDGAPVYGGTLDIPGHGAWPVTCVGP